MPGTKEGAAKARATRAAKVEPMTDVQPVERPRDAAQERLEARFGSVNRQGIAKPTHYVVARRALNWEGLVLEPGDVVPGAEEWPRLEAWVRAGRVAPAYGALMTTSAPEPVEAAEPEELPENQQSAPEDDDPLSLTGEPIEEPPLEEVSK